MKPLEARILAQKILKFKDKNDLTYQNIGDALGVDRSYINRVVKLKSFMSMPLMIKLAKFMGVPMYTLFVPSDEFLRKAFIEEANSKMIKEKVSLEQLSKKSNISPVRLQDILDNKSIISRNERQSIANCLDIDLLPYDDFY